MSVTRLRFSLCLLHYRLDERDGLAKYVNFENEVEFLLYRRMEMTLITAKHRGSLRGGITIARRETTGGQTVFHHGNQFESG